MRDATTSVIYLLIVYFFGLFDLFKFGSFEMHGPPKEKKARFISFDSNDGKIDLELNLAVPFITIPLKNKEKDKGDGGKVSPLVSINTKGIAVLGILVATTAFIVPLFIKPIPEVHQHYRMAEDLEWWNLGQTVNEILLHNRYVTPCIQRVLCSVVTRIKRSENPTSTGKMIDGIVSHRWFQQFANGSVILDAIKAGEEIEKDCPTVYKECLLNQNMIDNSLKVELELTVPFISIPLQNKGGKEREPLVTINTKGVAVLGTIIATSAFILPFFIDTHHQSHPKYRMDQESESWNVDQTVQDLLSRGGYVTPCVQRTLCSLITTVKQAQNPTSTQKIIDGLFSNKWLQEYANDSLIMDAITTGQGTEKDCLSYKGCPLPEGIIDNTLRALNII